MGWHGVNDQVAHGGEGEPEADAQEAAGDAYFPRLVALQGEQAQGREGETRTHDHGQF